ncbi:hypothetical protein HN51_032552, partial [Arachis hypogaea]
MTASATSTVTFSAVAMQSALVSTAPPSNTTSHQPRPFVHDFNDSGTDIFPGGIDASY